MQASYSRCLTTLVNSCDHYYLIIIITKILIELRVEWFFVRTMAWALDFAPFCHLFCPCLVLLMLDMGRDIRACKSNGPMIVLGRLFSLPHLDSLLSLLTIFAVMGYYRSKTTRLEDLVHLLGETRLR